MAAQRLGAARRLSGLALHTREHRQVDAGTEVLAMGREYHRSHGGFAVGPLEAVLELPPHGRAHRVGLVGPVEKDLGNVAVDPKIQGFEAWGLDCFLLHVVLVCCGAERLPGAVKGGGL